MRFVPTLCLREGMLLGDNLYGNNHELMLSRGAILSQELIEAIKRLNFNGIYIDDDLSRDIHIHNIINDKVRAQTIEGIKDIFIHTEEESAKVKTDLKSAHQKIESIVDEILKNKKMMVNMIDMKVFDDYTYCHCVNVAVLSIAIGVSIGLAKKDLCNLGFAAILHDIGKVFINKEILNKDGKLTNEEFDIIKSHPLLGCDYIKRGYGLPYSSYKGILDHHEKFIGGGYPNNIRGDKISLYGRIISLTDVYDALTSDRPYRKAKLPSEAMEYIMGSYTTLFDPDLVSIFVRKIAPYPIGTLVKLSNKMTGIVLENYEDLCMRPKVRIYKDDDREITPYEINLTDNDVFNITIVEVIKS